MNMVMFLNESILHLLSSLHHGRLWYLKDLLFCPVFLLGIWTRLRNTITKADRCAYFLAYLAIETFFIKLVKSLTFLQVLSKFHEDMIVFMYQTLPKITFVDKLFIGLNLRVKTAWVTFDMLLEHPLGLH